MNRFLWILNIKSLIKRAFEPEDDQIEVEVDMEGKHLKSLHEIYRLGRKNQKHKEKLQAYEEKDHVANKVVILLKEKSEEEKRVEDILIIQIQVKEKNCENLVVYEVSQGKDLEQSKA